MSEPASAHQVLWLAAAAAATVLGLNLLRVFVPQLGTVLQLVPVVIVAMVVVTGLVLLGVLRGRRGR